MSDETGNPILSAQLRASALILGEQDLPTEMADLPDLLTRAGTVLEAAERVNKGIEEAADKLAEHYSNLQRDFKLGIEVATRGLSKRAEAAEGERDRLREAATAVNSKTFSHIGPYDDLFARFHPRRSLDLKRRVDAKEDWFEADWLSDLWRAVKELRIVLAALTPEQPDSGKG